MQQITMDVTVMQMGTLLHFQSHQHNQNSSTRYLQVRCPSCRPNNNVTALNAISSSTFDTQNNKLCGRPPQYTRAPCKFTFDLESGVRVTCDVGYLCANFSLPRPLCSRLRPDVPYATDTQTHIIA